MRVASIDIGTNTLLLLVADVGPGERLEVVEHQVRMPRLGRGVDAGGAISVAMFDRVGWILGEYRDLAVQLRCDRIVAVATSAVRDAANRADFLGFILRTTGIRIEVLDGADEARWAYIGAVRGVPGIRMPAAVIDIGGGSTELTFAKGRNGSERLEHTSTQLGAVRLTERIFRHAPPLREEIDSARNLIREEWAQVLNPGFHDYQLVGVAGTATTLAALDLGLTEFDVGRISGHMMSQAAVAAWAARLCGMAPEAIRSLSAAAEGRHDILAAGAVILAETMQLFGFHALTVSERGLRFGIAWRELGRA